jgi:hypothetical protein
MRVRSRNDDAKAQQLALIPEFARWKSSQELAVKLLTMRDSKRGSEATSATPALLEAPSS